jgi:hypothetical protein
MDNERVSGILWAEDYIQNLIFNKRLPETKVLIASKLSAISPKSEYERGVKFAFSEFLDRYSQKPACNNVPF